MDQIELAWRRGWSPIDRRKVREWARGLELAGDYAQKGFFRVDESRQLIDPLDALTDDQVRMINLRKGVQTFGSGVGDLFFHWVRANAPDPFMATFQADDDATHHFETRLRPTMEKNEASKASIAALRQKRTLYRFPEFNAHFQGANVNSLQGKSQRYLWNDEIWRWKRGLLAEAFARTEKFKNRCKILNISQGGLEGDDEDLNWNAGRLHAWSWPCPKCRHVQSLEFFGHILDAPEKRAGIIWNQDARRPDGRWDIGRAAASARLVCVKCGFDLPDESRSWGLINAISSHVCLTPDLSRKNLSFRWNSLVGGYWADLVDEYLKAIEAKRSGTLELLKKFYQKKLALPWSDEMSETVRVLKTGEYMMREPLPAKIDGEKIVWRRTFMTCDYQEGSGNEGEHWWVRVRAWARGGRSRGIFYGRLKDEAAIRALQLELKIPDPCVICDGGDRLLYIAGICARFGWTIFRGEDDEYFKHFVKGHSKPRLRAWSQRKKVDPGRGTKLQGKRFAWCIDWSNPSVKNITWRLRHGHGAPWEIEVDIPQTYRDQIDSEAKIRVISKMTGTVSYYWKPLSSHRPNNHAWDDENMQTAAALMDGILIFDLNDNQRPDAKARDGVAPAPRPGDVPVAPHDRPDQLELAGVVSASSRR